MMSSKSVLIPVPGHENAWCESFYADGRLVENALVWVAPSILKVPDWSEDGISFVYECPSCHLTNGLYLPCSRCTSLEQDWNEHGLYRALRNQGLSNMVARYMINHQFSCKEINLLFQAAWKIETIA